MVCCYVSEKVEPSDDFHGVVEKRAFVCVDRTDGFQRESSAPFFLIVGFLSKCRVSLTADSHPKYLFLCVIMKKDPSPIAFSD